MDSSHFQLRTQPCRGHGRFRVIWDANEGRPPKEGDRKSGTLSSCLAPQGARVAGGGAGVTAQRRAQRGALPLWGGGRGGGGGGGGASHRPGATVGERKQRMELSAQKWGRKGRRGTGQQGLLEAEYPGKAWWYEARGARLPRPLPSQPPTLCIAGSELGSSPAAPALPLGRLTHRSGVMSWQLTTTPARVRRLWHK